MATRAIVARGAPPSRRGSWGVLLGLAALVAVAALVLIVVLWSGASLSTDPVALARVELQPFAGNVTGATAVGADGRSIPVAFHDGRVTPLVPVRAGELISVEVRIRRPSWLGWAVGGGLRTEHLTVRTPTAHLLGRWLTVPAGAPVRVRYDAPVTAVAYGAPGHLVRQTLDGAQRSVALLEQAPAGSVEIAAAARPWEAMGAPVTVQWFPPGTGGVLVANPAPGAKLAPSGAIRLTLSRPIGALFGSSAPQLVPAVPGRWTQPDSHTLVFTPSGVGIPLSTTLNLELPHAVIISGAVGAAAQPVREISWPTPAPSTLRLQELLAQLGYLPLGWAPSGPPVARTAAAQLTAAVSPPPGTFTWRYPNTPHELQSVWRTGTSNVIARGAVMTFEQTHGLAVDGIAGPMVWHALLSDALAGKHRGAPYSYVLVHERVPQLLTLWSAGHVVVASPGNTGIASRPTQRGTFPVFEHVTVGTMSGTNPDGSHYHDPGIRYISYFNGGDAIHAFPRASFGTPQSLGCVELPLASAAKVWPYTPIGTLVTVEN